MRQRRQSAQARAKSRTPLDRQPDLFAASAAAWVTRNWPQYERATVGEYDASPLLLWATTFDDLPAGARRLLMTLCVEVERGSCRASIATLAKVTASSSQAIRQRLDKLLAAGLVVVRPWTAKCKAGVSPLGYEFRVLVDEDQRAAALSAGFTTTRATARRTTTTGAGCP